MGDASRPRQWFCGGGAGYTLNRLALKTMVRVDFPKSRCKPEGYRSDEDRVMGVCLRKNRVHCHHDVDELDEARYHHYDAQFHAVWTKNSSSNWNWRQLWKHQRMIVYKEKIEGISATSVTFHLVGKSQFRDQGLRRYHALLYKLC